MKKLFTGFTIVLIVLLLCFLTAVFADLLPEEISFLISYVLGSLYGTTGVIIYFRLTENF
ncbi:hypothetical protein AB0Y20_01055 [Heyndrickxia oleronia]|uniref:hypothetical protein n=1 Tax=Heyndrickxia oleronia TaxID=38875 RepID=UPI003F258CDA